MSNKVIDLDNINDLMTLYLDKSTTFSDALGVSNSRFLEIVDMLATFFSYNQEGVKSSADYYKYLINFMCDRNNNLNQAELFLITCLAAETLSSYKINPLGNCF